MNLTIQILSKDTAPGPSKPAPKPSLEDRIDYAIECVYCDVNKAQALDFLQKAHAHLDSLPRQDKKSQVLLEKVTATTNRYGHYLLPTKKPIE